MSDNDVVEFCLPGGAVLLARAERINTSESDDEEAGPADVGLRDFLSFSHVSGAIRSLAGELHDALSSVSPDRVTVELGFDLAVKGSQLLALVADAGTQASVRVRLEWDRGHQNGKDEPGEESAGDEAGDDEATAD